MKKLKLRQSLLLLLTAVIWGVAFVAQSAGMEYVGPFTFNAVRSVIGGIVLIPCIFILRKINTAEETGKPDRQNSDVNYSDEATGDNSGIKDANKSRSLLLTGGVICGIILCVASTLQQVGIKYTTVGKAGFVTALYIIIVPILSIFLHKKAGFKVWLGVVIAVIGFYLLCISENLVLEVGDLLVLLCAFGFSLHIMAVDYFAPKVDGVKMSCIQFFVCGLLCSVLMFLFESPDTGLILAAWKPILYAGVLSCGVAYTLQIIGQRA